MPDPQHSSPGATRAPAGAVLALVAAAFAMGISPVFVRWADVGPFSSAFWRVALALPVLFAWMQAEERGGRPAGQRAFALPVVLAGLAFSGDLFFWHLAIFNTSVANATFFATTAPIFVALAGWLLFRTQVTPAVLGGMGLCLLGGAALVAQSFAIAPGRLLGDVFGVCTAVFFGLYFLAVGAARNGSGAGRVTFEASCITALVPLVVALAFEPRLLPGSGQGWAALLAMAFISHAGGQGLLAVALGRLPALFSSLVIFLEAVAAALFGWLLLGEPVTIVQALGGVLILAGIFASRPRAAKAGSLEPPGLP